MQITYNEKDGFLKGKSDRKPNEYQIVKKGIKDGFDVTDLSIWYNITSMYWHFTANIAPLKQITKELETEILSKLDILFQRKNYSKEEKQELIRLVTLWK